MREEVENPMVLGDYYQKPAVYTTCELCNAPIYEGETFYLIDGAPVCETCIEGRRRTA